jgi:hypothetical protein
MACQLSVTTQDGSSTVYSGHRRDPSAIELPLPSWLSRGDIAVLCDRLTELCRVHESDTVICDVSQIDDPTMVTIETLTKLRLTAGRLGLRLRLRRTGPRLRSLLDLTGLSRALPEHVD